jgi:hypothetical protein
LPVAKNKRAGFDGLIRREPPNNLRAFCDFEIELREHAFGFAGVARRLNFDAYSFDF